MIFLSLTTCKFLAAETKFRPARLCFVANESPSESKSEETPKAPPKSFAEVGDELNEEASRAALEKAKVNRAERKEVVEEDRNRLAALRAQLGEPGQKPKEKPEEDKKGKEDEGKKKEKKKGAPERSPEAMTGKQFLEAFAKCKTQEERQKLILAQANANAFSPDSLKTKSYETTTSKGVKIRVNMYDGIEFGVPGDSVRVCMDGPTSQAIADMLGGVLPSPEFYNRLYGDPSVPKVPFFSGEQLESAVNAWRKENGIPTNLNINYIDERGKPIRNGAAMKSADYMYMHHKFLEYWMDKHNIDRSRVNVGSRKTVFAPVADDGKIAFGGGLYAMPVTEDGKIVDYKLTNKLVQGDGSIDGNFSVDHHAHEPPYFDYASGTSVVKSVDVGNKNVPIKEFMTSEEYAEMRTEIFGKRSSMSNRYQYPSWMSEYVQDYRQKHGGDVVLDASDVSQKPDNTPIFEGIPQAEIQKGKVVEEFDYTVAQGAPGGHVKFVKTSAGNVAVMDWQGKEYQVKVDFNNASGVDKQKDGYAASGGEIAGPFAYILLRYFREHEGKVGDLIPFEYNGRQYVAEYQIHPPDASSSINHPGVGIMEKKDKDQYSRIPSGGWKPSPDSKPSEGGTLRTAVAAPKPGAGPSAGPSGDAPPSAPPRRRVASGGGMPAYGGGAPAYTPSGTPSYTPSYTPAVYTPAPGGGTEQAYYRPAPAPVVKTSPAEKKETGERPTIKGNTLFCGDSMTVAMPESSGRRNLNVDGEIDTIAQGSKTTSWLLEQLQSYEKTDRIKSMKNMVVLIGTNDIGGNESAQAIFDRIQKIWEIGKRNNLKVYACTIPPFKGWKNFESRFDSINQKRKDINELIMKSGTPDMVVKLHELMADPNDPDKLADEYNYNGKGDHLHPDKVKHARLIESVIGERPAPSDKPAAPEKPADAVDNTSLAGFETDPYLQEKTKTYNYPEGDPQPLRVHINAPANFDRKKPTRMVVFTLPAGNTIEQTIGAKKQPGQDWHYEIQQIGAQVRKLREISPGENIVVAYVEAPNLNPGGWKKDQPGRGQIMAQLFEDVRSKLAVPQVTIDISGHSAGRSLKFSYIDEQPQIPDNVKRLSFLDSNHSYNPARGEKIVKWLKAAGDHYLTVIAYDDRNVTYQGKPVAGAVGYERTYEMIAFFQQQGITLTREQKNGYVQYSGLDGRVNFLVMDNPQNKILHTETVFRNGLLYAETSGTALEASAGQFNGPLTFEQYIQDQPSQLALSAPGPNPEPPNPEKPKEAAETAEVLLDFKYGLAGQPATKPARLMKGPEGTYVEFELGKLYVNLETGNPDVETIKKNHDPATFAEAGHIAYLLLHLNGALKRPMNSVIGYKYNGKEGVARYEIHNDGPNGPNPNDHEGVGIWMKTTVVA